MRLTIRVEHAREVVICAVSGEVTDADILRGEEELRSHPEFRPEYGQLIDLRGADGARVTPVGVRALVERPAIFSQESLRAIVVSDEVAYGLAQSYQEMRDENLSRVRIFRELGEAWRWLVRGSRR